MYVSKEEAEEAWYTDTRGVNTANAAVLFNDTFRIVLRAKKAEGRQTYEAVLVSSGTSSYLTHEIARTEIDHSPPLSIDPSLIKNSY